MLLGICMFRVQYNNAILNYFSNLGYIISEECSDEVKVVTSTVVGAMGWLVVKLVF